MTRCVMDASTDGSYTSTDEQQKKETRNLKSKSKISSGLPFSLKKWNAVAMWQWDVECDTCAICRVQVMGRCICIQVTGILNVSPQISRLHSL